MDPRFLSVAGSRPFFNNATKCFLILNAGLDLGDDGDRPGSRDPRRPPICLRNLFRRG